MRRIEDRPGMLAGLTSFTQDDDCTEAESIAEYVPHCLYARLVVITAADSGDVRGPATL